ncbi:hypothetical protein SESBI_31965 [Sesbania bispinosa]|nr:hypothetical protein SESBI_31965 [Sesbania bispinosa]
MSLLQRPEPTVGANVGSEGIQAVKNRLDGIDQRINGLSLRVYALDEKTNTILFFMKNKDYDENRCTEHYKAMPNIQDLEHTYSKPEIHDTEVKRSIKKEWPYDSALMSTPKVAKSEPQFHAQDSRNSKKKDWPLDTILKMSTSTPKSVTDDSPKGVTTMIFDISDDEEDMNDIMSGHMAMKPMSLDRGKTILETVNEHIQPPTLHNNYKRVHMTDPLGDKSKISSKVFLGKNLFPTPTRPSTSDNSKKARLDKISSSNPSTNGPPLLNATQTEDIKKNGLDSNILPKNVKSRFRPTSDMQLTELELKVVAYVFGYHHDEDEVLIKIGEYVGGRKRLHSLCPDKVVANKIIELAALKGTWKECQSSSQGVWYCPPRFAV